MKIQQSFFVFFCLSAVCAACGGSSIPPKESSSTPGDSTPPKEPEAPAPTLFDRPPADWRAEIIPLPLDFAPEIPLAGLEELRFAPGMFDPSSGGYFTYAFVWWLNGRLQISAAELERYLLAYFKGLYTVVSKKKDKDISGFNANLSALDPDRSMRRFTGQVTWTDPFATELPVTLNVEISQWKCEKTDRTVLLFLLSPKPTGNQVWNTLRQLTVLSCDDAMAAESGIAGEE